MNACAARSLTALTLAVTLLGAPTTAEARVASESDDGTWSPTKSPHRGVYEISGEGFVHNVGNLWMNVTNLGTIGNPWKSLSVDPSGQYPPGSGVEYLFAAGIWVGAHLGNDPTPHVSTSYWPWEFRPSLLPVHTIYESYEGYPDGDRLYNDDNDYDEYGRELIDEEIQDGIDNDGDGLIDEDFAAISQQMFTCVYRDDASEALSSYADHVPLGLEVVQRSFTWAIPGSDNFVGFEFTIKNDGKHDLRDLYLGVFCDSDCGPVGRHQYWADDRAGLVEVDTLLLSGRTSCANRLRIMIAETHDGDGDEGLTEGWFGATFLGHTTDPRGEKAPPNVEMTSFRFVSGGSAYEQCGDPQDDYQRYDLLSGNEIGCGRTGLTADQDADYRLFFGTGPFKELKKGEELTLQVAFVVGRGRDGMMSNAFAAQRIYSGVFENVDGDTLTGVKGKESCLTAEPGKEYTFDYVDHCGLPDTLRLLPEYRPVAITALDCEGDNRRQYVDLDCDPCTGIEGKESVVRWRGPSTPPCPQVVADFPIDEDYPCHTLEPDLETGLPVKMKIRGPAVQLKPQDNAILIRWNNASQLVPDPFSKKMDFAGYRIWKAEQWDRPAGSIGPAPELWSLLAEYRLAKYLEPGTCQTDLIAARSADWKDIAPCDTVSAADGLYLYPVGYYEHRDDRVLNGFLYFYAVTAFDVNQTDEMDPMTGEPAVFSLACRHTASEEQSVVPCSNPVAGAGDVYVVPNPYYGSAVWDLTPNPTDPTGAHVDFMNLPRGEWTIRIFTVAGDLVRVLTNDGPADLGQASWDLVSRRGQDIVSGVYLFSVESRYGTQVGKFAIIRD